MATLTTDAGRILSKLHQVQPEGAINLLTGVRIAHVICSFSNLSYRFRLFTVVFLLIVGSETPTRKKPPHTNYCILGIPYQLRWERIRKTCSQVEEGKGQCGHHLLRGRGNTFAFSDQWIFINMNFSCQNGGTDVLANFITTLNGKEGTGSHLVTIPPGTCLKVMFVGLLTIFLILWIYRTTSCRCFDFFTHHSGRRWNWSCRIGSRRLWICWS